MNKILNNMNENIDKKKSPVVFIIVAIVIVILIVIAAIFTFKGDDKKTPVGTTNKEQSTETQAPDPMSIAIQKDSILRSADSGMTFETYFGVNTTKQLGAVDVLNITFHPTKEDYVVVSTYDDGLFLNDSGKNLWEPISFPPQQIYSFILDNKDPDNRAFASGVITGNGRIFRTENKGNEWRAVYAEPGGGTYVSALTQDPSNNNLILAGTSGGTLVRSIDGGDTWKNIGQKINGSINRFAYDSTKVSFAYLLIKGGKIYHSFDGGLNWLNWEEEKLKEIKNLNNQASELSRGGNKAGAQNIKEEVARLQQLNKTAKAPSGIVTIVADPSRSGVLYAGLNKGLYKSTDYGKYWSKVNIIESAEKFPILSIAVNPDNSDEISFVSGNSFYRSINNGITWAVTPLDKTRNASFVAYDPFDTDVIYVGLSGKK